MALTAAEKMKVYRQRLKEKGGRVAMITLSPDDLKMLALVAKVNFPDLEPDDLLRGIFVAAVKRTANQLIQAKHLKEMYGASDEIVNQYNEFHRREYRDGMVMTVDKYLEFIREMDELSEKYRQEQLD